MAYYQSSIKYKKRNFEDEKFFFMDWLLQEVQHVVVHSENSHGLGHYCP